MIMTGGGSASLIINTTAGDTRVQHQRNILKSLSFTHAYTYTHTHTQAHIHTYTHILYIHTHLSSGEHPVSTCWESFLECPFSPPGVTAATANQVAFNLTTNSNGQSGGSTLMSNEEAQFGLGS